MRCDTLRDALDAGREVTELWLGDFKAKTKLVGLERLVSLTDVTLGALDDDTCERLAELPELTTLQLNHATQISARIEQLPSVRIVKLVGCDDLDLAGALRKLAALSTLDALEIDTHAYKTVRGVIQPGRVLPDGFAALTQVRELTVMRGFHPFPPSIGSMKKLETLSIGVNAFEAIPKTIGKLQRLTSLDLRSTPITALPDELCECTALQVLELMNCRKLASLPRELGRLENLYYLNLERTAIKALPASAAQLGELRRFHAPGTRALNVPEGFMAGGADELVGPPSLLAQVELNPIVVEDDQDSLEISDPERVPKTFGNPRQLRLELPSYQKPLPQLAELEGLETLDLDVRDLDAAFRHLARSPRLRTLTVWGEQRVLAPSIGGLRALTHLTLFAPFRKLPEQLCALSRLEHLIVASPASLPSRIGELVELRSLQAHYSRLPSGLAGCIRLVELDATAKTKAELSMIAGLPALDVLSLRCDAGVDLAPLFRTRPRALSRLKLVGEVSRLPGVTDLAVRTLELESSEVAVLPPEARGWTMLEHVTVRSHGARAFKPSLPAGRWRKVSYTDGNARYERSK